MAWECFTLVFYLVTGCGAIMFEVTANTTISSNLVGLYGPVPKVPFFDVYELQLQLQLQLTKPM